MKPIPRRKFIKGTTMAGGAMLLLPSKEINKTPSTSAISNSSLNIAFMASISASFEGGPYSANSCIMRSRGHFGFTENTITLSSGFNR